MRDPAGLYDISTDVTDVPKGLHLVAGLTGFADAGSAVSQLSAYLLATLDHSVVAEFDSDALLDYRARRPTIYFDQDHLTDYRPAKLNLYLMNDEIGQPFLLLTGYEPDFQWERFSAAVLQFVDKYKVKTTTWVHAIPMPVPHTRPIGVTVSGNRVELIDAISIWKPHTQAPATALHLIEYRLHELGHPTAGFVLLIPHYLADTEYPAAAVTALESVSAEVFAERFATSAAMTNSEAWAVAALSGVTEVPVAVAVAFTSNGALARFAISNIHTVMEEFGTAEEFVSVNGVTSPCCDGALGYSSTPICWAVVEVMSLRAVQPVAGVSVIEPVAEVLENPMTTSKVFPSCVGLGQVRTGCWAAEDK